MNDVRDRCLKLRALSRSSCEAEAVSAMGELHRLMTLNGLTSADLDAAEDVRVRVDGRVSFTRRALALTASVSRDCQMYETAMSLVFGGRASAVASAREVYRVLVEVTDARSKVPTFLAHAIERKSAEDAKKLTDVCREYFEIGLFRGVEAKLQPPARLGKFKSILDLVVVDDINDLPVFGEKKDPKASVEGIDRAAKDLVALVAPEAKVKEYAAELKQWATQEGEKVGRQLKFPKWAPSAPRAAVRGLLPAPDPEDVRRRDAEIRTLQAFSSELNLEV